jgi:ABC-2 type transport system permease protein
VLFGPPLLLDLLPGSWKTTIGPYIPRQSGSYAAAAVLAGFVIVSRRDA